MIKQILIKIYNIFKNNSLLLYRRLTIIIFLHYIELLKIINKCLFIFNLFLITVFFCVILAEYLNLNIFFNSFNEHYILSKSSSENTNNLSKDAYISENSCKHDNSIIQANRLDQSFTKADFELSLENNPAFRVHAYVVNEPLPGNYHIINRDQAIEASCCIGCYEVINAYDRAIDIGRLPIITQHEDCGHVSIGPNSCHNCSIIENNLEKLPISHPSVTKPLRSVSSVFK